MSTYLPILFDESHYQESDIMMHIMFLPILSEKDGKILVPIGLIVKTQKDLIRETDEI